MRGSGGGMPSQPQPLRPTERWRLAPAQTSEGYVLHFPHACGCDREAVVGATALPAI